MDGQVNSGSPCLTFLSFMLLHCLDRFDSIHIPYSTALPFETVKPKLCVPLFTSMCGHMLCSYHLSSSTKIHKEYT